jgi:hypothetical protein
MRGRVNESMRIFGIPYQVRNDMPPGTGPGAKHF